MAEPTRMKAKPTAKQGESSETSELYEAVRRSKPIFSSNEEAIRATVAQLEKLAAEHDQAVEELIRDAHTARLFQPHHIEVLQLERQLAFLRR